jgi:hypothetical protein
MLNTAYAKTQMPPVLWAGDNLDRRGRVRRTILCARAILSPDGRVNSTEGGRSVTATEAPERCCGGAREEKG